MTGGGLTQLNDLAEFVELSTADIDNVAQAWRVLGDRVPGILDEFYTNRIMTDDKWRMKDFCLVALKRKQVAYWRVLFSGTLDEVYSTHARAIAMKHKHYGVTLSDYIASYGWFLNAFEKALRAGGVSQEKLGALMGSIRRLVFLDMTIAASTYYVVYVD